MPGLWYVPPARAAINSATMARNHHIGLLGIDHVGIEAEAAALGTGAIDSQVIDQRTRHQILAPSNKIAPTHRGPTLND